MCVGCPCAHTLTRSQAVAEVPLNPPSSADKCGIQASLARAAPKGAAARKVRRASPDPHRFLTNRPARPVLTAPPQVSLPDHPFRRFLKSLLPFPAEVGALARPSVLCLPERAHSIPRRDASPQPGFRSGASAPTAAAGICGAGQGGALLT